MPAEPTAKPLIAPRVREGVRVCGRHGGEQRTDRPLSVERLTEAELIAAARAVATILAVRYAGTPAPAQAPFSLMVHWYDGPAGEWWLIDLRDATVAFDREAAAAEAERLLQPILKSIRPRALRHVFRSRIDEATLEDINTIGNAGVMPSADAFEPRWVEDRTVLWVSPGTAPGHAGLQDAEAVLADISSQLAAG